MSDLQEVLPTCGDEVPLLHMKMIFLLKTSLKNKDTGRSEQIFPAQWLKISIPFSQFSLRVQTINDGD